MKSLPSSVLVINHPNQEEIEFGANFADNFIQATEILNKNKQAVISFALSNENFQSEFEFIQYINKHYQNMQVVLVLKKQNLKQMQKIINETRVHHFCQSFSGESFSYAIHQALEHYGKKQQNAELFNLVHSENEQLKQINIELEERVHAREAKLNKAKTRALSVNQRVEALHRSLIAIHNASSIAQMENVLADGLKNTFDLSLVRIAFSHQFDMIERNLTRSKYYFFAANISYAGQPERGKVYFCRHGQKKFRQDEIRFLNQVAEAITLSIDRFSKLEQSEVLKQQWEATFNAIANPICLCDENFNLINFNTSFLLHSDKSFKQAIDKSIFLSFHNVAPPNTKELSKKKFVRRPNVKGFQKHYEFSIKKIETDESSDILNLVFIRDLTEQKKLEKQILESSKMAELGTIGSSIAHEINNPLGGMISFLQLMLMDIKKTHPFYEDIDEMHRAAQKCKDIVENLLGFARKNELSDKQEIVLNEVLHRAVKLSGLQSLTRGINIDILIPDKELKITGAPNMLTQAFRNIIQNAIESIYEKQKDDPRYDGQVRVELKQDSEKYIVTITDNGIGIAPKNLNKIFNPLFSTKKDSNNSGLGLTVAFKIITEHRGLLEIYSQPKIGSSAKISFQRPDLSN